MARPQVNTNLGGPEIVQTVARPMGISAPVATVQPSPLMGLAQSLAELRPEINGLIKYAADDYQEKEATRAYDTIQGMTYEQSKEAVSNGEMRKTESPWFRAAFQKQFGLTHANERRREIITAYNNEFDKDGGDINSFLAKYAQDDFETFGDSEFIRAGIREGMDGLFKTVKDQQAEYLDGQLQARTGEQFFSVANRAVSDAVENGGDVNAALTGIYADHESALGMTPDAMDAKALLLAEKYANEGDTAAVDAILNADPTGNGSFNSRSGFAATGQKLHDTSVAKAGETHRTANTNTRVGIETRAGGGMLEPSDLETLTAWTADGQLSQDAHEGLLIRNDAAIASKSKEAADMRMDTEVMGAATQLVREGRGYAVQDVVLTNPVDGSTRTVTGEDLKKRIVLEQLDALSPQGTVVMAQQLSEWGVGANYPVWEDSLSGGYLALTGALAKPNKDGGITVPPAAQTAYTLYKELGGTKNLRDRHIKDSTAGDVYRDAEILESTGMMAPDEALLASANLDRKISRANLATSVDRDKFNSAVRGATGGGWFSSAPVNGGMAGVVIEQHARILMDMGIPMPKAIEKATASFEASYTPINGVLVNTRDRLLPGNFAEITAAHLEDYVTAHPDEDISGLTMWPITGDQDQWMITDEFGVPAPGSMKFHISQLQKNPRAYSMADANKEVVGNR